MEVCSPHPALPRAPLALLLLYLETGACSQICVRACSPGDHFGTGVDYVSYDSEQLPVTTAISPSWASNAEPTKVVVKGYNLATTSALACVFAGV